MGKKSKSKGGGKSRAGQDSAPKPAFDKKQSRVKRIETAEDAMGGDEDHFHANRDSVLFEDTGRSGNDDGLELSDDDEIFGLNLPTSDSDDDADLAADSDDDEGLDDEDDEMDTIPSVPVAEPARGRFAKVANPSQDVISDGGDSDASAASAASDSEEEEETWAANSYHATRRAPGEPDSSDDEALGMEADEARRLQKRAKLALAGGDYGVAGDDEEEGESVEEVRERERKRGRLEDEVVVLGAADKKEMGDDEAIAFLLREHPETLALLDDFTESAERIKSVEKNLEEVRNAGQDGNDHPALAIMELEHQALSTYLPTLAFYFSLLLTPSPSTDLVAKVLERLSTLRAALATMEELDLTSAGIDDSEEEDDSEEDEGDEDEMMLASDVWDQADALSDDEDEVEGEFGSESESGSEGSDGDDEEGMLGGLDDEEIEAIMDTMDEDATADDLIAKVAAYRREKFGLAPSDSEFDSASDSDSAPLPSTGSKRKASSSSSTPSSKKAKRAPATIPTLAPLTKSKKTLSTPISTSDYADATSLSLTDLSDKASKRHSLRFHVSQVSQKEAKRASGGKNRVGGDEDLPRRSKERSRREVLKRQEHGGGKGEELDGEEWGEGDRETARKVKNGGEDPEEYYDLVGKSAKEGKAAKQTAYDSARMAEKLALDAEGDASAAGPRGVTRKILANKGLQPKRAKINRNSRVKKRAQYDKAVKKVATMKSVYKGGQATLGHGEYQGEKSGIGAKVVKSVRLGGK